MAEHFEITPSGVGILFEDGDKDPATGKGKKRKYTIAAIPGDEREPIATAVEWVREKGDEFPSVSKIIGILSKGGLDWAAAKLTVAGCVELAAEGDLPQDPDAVIGRLFARELWFRQVWDRKADRGKLSHEDLVHIAAGRDLPPLDAYSSDQRAFVQGIAGFLADFRPTIHESEQMVASLKHGYSGRPDLVVTLGIDRLPDGSGPAPQGRGLLDLKTHEKLPRNAPTKACPAGPVKTPYPDNHVQLGLYEVARVESGYQATDWRAVLSVDSKGRYDFTCSWLEPEDALHFLPAFRTFKSISSRVKKPADQRPVGFDQALKAAA